MPAYRSKAEAEIREPTVARLRELMPDARIIHEINCASFGPTRIDVLAVSKDRIVAVEVKSARDKLDRLEPQITAMRGCAHHVIAALHGKFFSVRETPNAGTWVIKPKQARDAVVWGFDVPAGNGSNQYRIHDLFSRRDKHFRCPPSGAIDILWRDELREIASRRILHGAISKLTMPELVDVICWNLSSAEITRDICAALRQRKCVEADPAVDADGGAGV